MSFQLVWTDGASKTYAGLRAAAIAAGEARKKSGEKKTSKPGGLFKQVVKCVQLLLANPRHPGHPTHEYYSIENPYKKSEKVFEAYVQSRTPGAYSLFWCYGPVKGEITILAITAHP